MISLTVSLKRDLRGRPLAVGTTEAPSRFGLYRYRSDGTVATETLAGAPSARSYATDGVGRTTSIVDPAFTQTLGYRTSGGAGQSLADGRITLEATRWAAAAFAGTPPGDCTRRYGFDPFGRIEEVATDEGSGTVTYDSSGNILARERPGQGSQSLCYDPASNRLDLVETGAADRMEVRYDGRGAVVGLGAVSLSHDGPGGRSSAIRTPTARLRYQFSADGERAHKRVSGQTPLSRLTVRAGRSTFAEYQADETTDVHVHGPTGLAALVLDGVDHAVSRDVRSVRAVCRNGQAEAQFDYLAFGALDEANTRPLPLTPRIRQRYTDQEWEAETGLYNYHARLYAPDIGRFLSPDPARETASPYAYAAGDPIDFVDPTGMIVDLILRHLGRVLYIDTGAAFLVRFSHAIDDGGWMPNYLHYFGEYHQASALERLDLHLQVPGGTDDRFYYRSLFEHGPTHLAAMNYQFPLGPDGAAPVRGFRIPAPPVAVAPKVAVPGLAKYPPKLPPALAYLYAPGVTKGGVTKAPPALPVTPKGLAYAHVPKKLPVAALQDLRLSNQRHPLQMRFVKRPAPAPDPYGDIWAAQALLNLGNAKEPLLQPDFFDYLAPFYRNRRGRPTAAIGAPGVAR